MANRSFQDTQYTLIKREVRLYAAVAVGAAGAVTLKKWVYPTLGAGPNARTYQDAPLATSLPSGVPGALQYNAGAEGVRSVTRTGVGAWTIKLQDNYQRLTALSFITENTTGAATVITVAKGPATGMDAVGGSEITVVFSSAASTPADPAEGDLILLSITLADGTEP